MLLAAAVAEVAGKRFTDSFVAGVRILFEIGMFQRLLIPNKILLEFLQRFTLRPVGDHGYKLGFSGVVVINFMDGKYFCAIVGNPLDDSIIPKHFNSSLLQQRLPGLWFVNLRFIHLAHPGTDAHSLSAA